MKELEKMKEMNEKSQEIGNFIEEFLKSKDILLAKYHKHSKNRCGYADEEYLCGWTTKQPIPLRYNIQELLAEYFKIDLKKAEEERCKILEDLRKRK